MQKRSISSRQYTGAEGVVCRENEGTYMAWMFPFRKRAFRESKCRVSTCSRLSIGTNSYSKKNRQSIPCERDFFMSSFHPESVTMIHVGESGRSRFG